MSLTPEERRTAAIQAPMGPGLLYPNTRVIQRPAWYQLVTPEAPRGARNEVTFSQVEPADAERVIDETIATYRAIGQPVKWYVGPWTTPADFGQRLTRRGFTRWGLRGVGCETSALFRPTPGIQVTEVTEARLDEYLAVQARGWVHEVAPSSLERQAHAVALATVPRVAHLFAAELNGLWVGTSALLVREGYGYLIGGQVLESARGRGAYRAMVAARLAFLASAGIPYAVSQARAATAAPILEKLGFETLFESSRYHLEP